MTEAKQLPIFNQLEMSKTDEVSLTWSFTRRETLLQCPRRYYYDYYGAKIEQERGQETINQLKELTNRHLRSGDLLHLAIRVFFQKPDAEDWLVGWIKKLYNADYKFSVGASQTITEQYPPKQLSEFYYKQPDADDNFDESEWHLLTSLENFLQSDAYSYIRQAGQSDDAFVERAIWVDSPIFKARGQIDLALPEENGLTIIDWKIGHVDPTSSLQLLFYALWAVDKLGYALDSIRLYYGQLRDGSLQPIPVQESDLIRVRARICQDLERMIMLDSYGNKGDAEAFPPCSLPKVCRLCPFQEICPGVATENGES